MIHFVHVFAGFEKFGHALWVTDVWKNLRLTRKRLVGESSCAFRWFGAGNTECSTGFDFYSIFIWTTFPPLLFLQLSIYLLKLPLNLLHDFFNLPFINRLPIPSIPLLSILFCKFSIRTIPIIIWIITRINTPKQPLQPQLLTSRLHHHNPYFFFIFISFLLEPLIKHLALGSSVFWDVFVYLGFWFILPMVVDNCYCFEVWEEWVLFGEKRKLILQIRVKWRYKTLLYRIPQMKFLERLLLNILYFCWLNIFNLWLQPLFKRFEITLQWLNSFTFLNYKVPISFRLGREQFHGLNKYLIMFKSACDWAEMAVFKSLFHVCMMVFQHLHAFLHVVNILFELLQVHTAQYSSQVANLIISGCFNFALNLVEEI